VTIDSPAVHTTDIGQLKSLCMRVEISTLVREARATTVYITHDQAEAFALADQVGVLENGRLVQLGTPEQIYTEPTTPFVARFTGLAGEVPARIKDREADGTVLVEPYGGTAFLARSRFATADPSATTSSATASSATASSATASSTATTATEEVTVLIRPTGVHLSPASGNGHHLTGRVTDVAFRGRGYEHAIDIDGRTRLTGVLADIRVPRGETGRRPARPSRLPRLPRLQLNPGAADRPRHGRPTPARHGRPRHGRPTPARAPARRAGQSPHNRHLPPRRGIPPRISPG